MENTQEKYPNLISAEIVADSLNQFGERITTMKLVFPRFILAELNTHRMFNRNSASSRAIPFKKMVKEVMERPFTPIAFQKDHIGMQGTEYITDPLEIEFATSNWLAARKDAIKWAEALNGNNSYPAVTKQLCNRLLEPFMGHTVLVTATEWEHFFELRCPSYKIDDIDNTRFKSWKDLISFIKGRDKVDDSVIESYEQFSVIEKLQRNKGQAEIHMMVLAEAMYDAYNESNPKQLEVGQWHIPFGDSIDETLLENIIFEENPIFEGDIEKAKLKVAVARCARISYETLGDNPVIDYKKDIKLHDDLLAMKHFSPFEHCAKVMNKDEYFNHIKTEKEVNEKIHNIYGWSRNFKGFQQYREFIE